MRIAAAAFDQRALHARKAVLEPSHAMLEPRDRTEQAFQHRGLPLTCDGHVVDHLDALLIGAAV
jgi:hypothetical protein